MITDELPTKLSDMLEEALQHLYDYENDPKYKIDMSEWCWSGGGVCYICLAGAAMLGSGSASARELENTTIPNDVLQKMEAINDARVGRLNNALHSLGQRHILDNLKDRTVTPYHQDPNKFAQEINDIITYLRELKL